MPEGNDGQQQGQQAIQTIPAGYIPAAERDSAAAAARREGDKEGYTKAQTELLDRYGVENLDQLDAAIKAAKDKADAEKSAQDRLVEREQELASAKDERKSYKERAEKAEGVLKTYLDKQREGIREEIVPLLDRMPVVEQLAYIVEHGDKLKSAPEPEPEPRRAPDATNGRMARYGDRSDSVASFNDRLRAQAFRSQ
ncbi:MAG: hypothetical protein M3R38_01840 [Actinomycetota bacterium]|nr:hypothetical protein [Actinomycetota bacterium]